MRPKAGPPQSKNRRMRFEGIDELGNRVYRKFTRAPHGAVVARRRAANRVARASRRANRVA